MGGVVVIGLLILGCFVYFCLHLFAPTGNVSDGPGVGAMTALRNWTMLPYHTLWLIVGAVIVLVVVYLAVDYVVSTLRVRALRKTRLHETEEDWRRCGVEQPIERQERKKVKTPREPRQKKPRDPWQARIDDTLNTRS